MRITMKSAKPLDLFADKCFERVTKENDGHFQAHALMCYVPQAMNSRPPLQIFNVRIKKNNLIDMDIELEDCKLFFSVDVKDCQPSRILLTLLPDFLYKNYVMLKVPQFLQRAVLDLVPDVYSLIREEIKYSSAAAVFSSDEIKVIRVHVDNIKAILMAYLTGMNLPNAVYTHYPVTSANSVVDLGDLLKDPTR